MIYGQLAKEYARNNNTYKVVSESDSIINYLIKEQSNYESLIVNESYMNDNERLVMEAKYEVLQEAVIGAIIAAIIAAITAVIGILMMIFKNGSQKIDNLKKTIKENEKKAEEKVNDINKKDEERVNKNNEVINDINKKGSSDGEDIEDMERRIREDRERKRKEQEQKEKEEERKKRIDQIIYEYKTSIIHHTISEKDFSSDEIKSISEKMFSDNNDKDLKGISLQDFSDLVSTNGLNWIISCLKKSMEERKRYIPKDNNYENYNYDEDKRVEDHNRGIELANNEVKKYLDEDKGQIELNKLLFTGWFFHGSERININTDQKSIDVLTEMYNKTLIPNSEVLFHTNLLMKDIEKLYNNSKVNINKDKVLLEKMKSLLEQYKRQNTDKINGYLNTAAEKEQMILKLNKLSIDRIKEAVTAWATIENRRLNLMQRIYARSSRLIKHEFAKKKYKEFSSKYGKDFTDRVKDPNEDN